jgi:multiple sugar transport system permease protein
VVKSLSKLPLALMLAPYLGGVVVLILVPAAVSLGLAFMHYDGLTPAYWAGLLNFQMFWIDPLETIAIQNSLYFTALAVPLRLGVALGLALLLARRGLGLYRAAVTVPTVIPDVAYALVWLWIFNPLYGPVNALLAWLGLPTPGWLADPATAKLVFVAMSLLQVGEGFVVLLVGLRSVPRELYAAAVVDGAGPAQLLRHITLPAIAPWLILLTYRDVILSFQYTFAPAMLMSQGDPYYSTLFLPWLTYEEAFENLRYGMAGAILVVQFAVSGALVTGLALVFRLWRGREAHE